MNVTATGTGTSALTSQDVEIASSRDDAAAADAVRRHHAQMAGALALRTDALLRAASRRRLAEAEDARQALVSWCHAELVPHAAAEEQAMYPAARAKPEGRLLVTGMLGEHQVIQGLVSEITQAEDPVSAAAAGRALRVVFESHLAKENEPGFPVLDARSVPHAIRHATIHGALDAVPPLGGMVLVAPHDPVPLLAQVEERFEGAFEVTYLERGPEAWRLAFLRRPAR